MATAKEFSEALTGARAVSRTTSATSPGAVAPATPARKLPNVRELVAWSVAAAALVAVALMALRPDVPDESGGLALFEVPLPKGIDPQPVGNQASVGLDPEGTTLVFQARDSTGRDPAIFLRRLDDPTIVRIRGTDDGRAPFLSPDGTQLLFSPRQVGAGGTGPAMRVNVLGGTPRVFIDSAPANGQISWAEDGPIVWLSMTRYGRCLLTGAQELARKAGFGPPASPVWLPLDCRRRTRGGDRDLEGRNPG